MIKYLLGTSRFQTPPNQTLLSALLCTKFNRLKGIEYLSDMLGTFLGQEKINSHSGSVLDLASLCITAEVRYFFQVPIFDLECPSVCLILVLLFKRLARLRESTTFQRSLKFWFVPNKYSIIF
jgi:hypothetical protein